MHTSPLPKKETIMKIKSYLLAGLATFALASCDESFNDWTEQAGNTQPDAVAFGNGAVSPVDLIDFSKVPEGTDSVQVCQITKMPTSNKGAYGQKFSITYTYQYLDGAETKTKTGTLNMGSTGKVAFSELKEYVESTYGKRPMERDMQSQAKVTFSNGSTASYLTSENFIVKVKPQAPVIEDAYYYVGAANKWNTTDKTYKLTNGGGDVYDDPVFSVVIPAPTNDDGTAADNWFKIMPASAQALDNPWSSPYVIGAATNGETAQKGTFVQGANDTEAKAWNITDTNAKYYKITIDMMARTYEVTPLNFSEYYYVAGDGNGWGANDFLSTSSYDGSYEGCMYLESQFKFRPNDGNNWDGCLGASYFGLTGNADDNILVAEPGYYQVKLNVVDKTMNLLKINSIGVIGDGAPNGWDSDVDMTYNKSENCWEIKDIVLKDGTIKFRSNDDWGQNPNWGGNLNNLTQGGDNIQVTAGTYDIKLYAFCNGKAHAVMTKK